MEAPKSLQEDTFHGAESVFAKQLLYITSDTVLDQNDHAKSFKGSLPDRMQFDNDTSCQLYHQRYLAYDKLKSFVPLHFPASSTKSATFSDQQQSLLLQAIRRDIGRHCSSTSDQLVQHRPSTTSSASKLSDALAEMAMRTLGLILSNSLGKLFNRSSIGKIIRMGTGVLYHSTNKIMVVLAAWWFGVWNINWSHLISNSRTIEMKDRSEDQHLVSEGWPALQSWSCWKYSIHQSANQEDRKLPSKADSFQLEYLGIEPTFQMASVNDFVTKEETSARLLALVDSLTWCLLSRSASASVVSEALDGFVSLRQNIPNQFIHLSERWLHALYPFLFDIKPTPACRDKALSVFRLVGAKALFPSPATSAILFEHLSPSKPEANPKKTHCKLWEPLCNAFASNDIKDVERALTAWGPIVSFLGRSLFENQIINQLLKLIQASFLHNEPAVRQKSFDSWSYLISAFSRMNDGLRVTKRLRLLMAPMAVVFSSETNWNVLHASWQAYQTLIYTMKSSISKDWPAVLGHPLQLLLRSTHAKERKPSITPTISGSSITSSNSSESLPGITSLELSVLDKCCLLLCSMVCDEAPQASPVLSPYDPFLRTEPPQQMEVDDVVLPAEEAKELQGEWNLSITKLEIGLVRALSGEPVKDSSSNPLGIPDPVPEDLPFTKSLLSLILALISTYIESAKEKYSKLPASASGTPATHADAEYDIAMAKRMWSCFCSNVVNHHRKNKKHVLEKQGSSNSFHVVDPQSITSWAILQMISTAFLSDCDSSSDSHSSSIWQNFLEDCLNYTATSVPDLLVETSNVLVHDQHHGQKLTSTIAKLIEWLLSPTLLNYGNPPSAQDATKSTSIWLPPNGNEFFYGTCDLLQHVIGFASNPKSQSAESPLESHRGSPALAPPRFRTEKGNLFCSRIVRCLTTLSKSLSNFDPQITDLVSLAQTESLYRLLPNFASDSNIVFDSVHPIFESTLIRTELAFDIWNIFCSTSESQLRNTGSLYLPLTQQSNSKVSNSTASSESKEEVPSEKDQLHTFKSSTLPSINSMTLQPNHLFSSSNSTTSDSRTANTSALTSTTSNSTFEVFHQQEMSQSQLKPLLRMIIFPLQHSKALLHLLDSLKPLEATNSALFVGKALVQTLSSHLLELIGRTCSTLLETISRISRCRFMTFKTDSSTGNSNETTVSYLNQASVFFVTLAQALMVLQDYSTIKMKNFSFANSQSPSQSTPSSQSNSKSLPGLFISMQRGRLWYCALWTNLFSIVANNLATIAPVSVGPASSIFNSKDFISSSTVDPTIQKPNQKESNHSFEDMISKSLSPLKSLTPTVPLHLSNSGTIKLSQKSSQGKPKSSTKEITPSEFSPYFKEDLAAFFLCAQLDKNILWSMHRSEDELPVDAPESPYLVPWSEISGFASPKSRWSSFISLLICALGDIWRSVVWLSKGAIVRKSKSTETKTTPTHAEPFHFDLTVSVLRSILNSGLCLLENWNHGNNLLIDLLPFITWALVHDNPALFLQHSGAVGLTNHLKKPMEQLGGATLAGIVRAFNSLSSPTSSDESTSKIYLASSAMINLLLRSSSTFLATLESKRAAIRQSAWRTWNHTFGKVHGIPLSLLDHHLIITLLDNPSEITIQDLDEWKAFSKREIVSRVVAPFESNQYDLSDAASPSIPIAASLYPTELVSHAKFSETEMETPEQIHDLPDPTSPYKPTPKKRERPEEIAESKVFLEHQPVQKKIKVPNASATFPPQKAKLGIKPPIEIITTAPSKSLDVTPILNNTKKNELQADKADSKMPIEPIDETTIPVTPFVGSSDPIQASHSIETSHTISSEVWCDHIKRLSTECQTALADPRLTWSALSRANQDVLSILTEIGKRMQTFKMDQ